ncbi:hypothetical protein FRC06_008228 [Ceratobasidium sp. 370]|nr:hypothetical protein FRC06_008228 [Ceratobasidium sp. 370]
MAANPALMQQFAAMLATQNASQGANLAAAPNPSPTQEEVDFHPHSSTIGRSSDPANAADEVECGRSPQCSTLLLPSPAPHTTIVATPPVLTLPPTTPMATGPPTLQAVTLIRLTAVLVLALLIATHTHLLPAVTHLLPAIAHPLLTVTRLLAPLTSAPAHTPPSLDPMTPPLNAAASPARVHAHPPAIRATRQAGAMRIAQPRKRGGCVTRTVNGKEEIVYTPVERLGTQEDKHEYFKTHRHLFGVKHDMYFNPYSITTSNLKNYKQITWPPGLQIGWRKRKVDPVWGDCTAENYDTTVKAYPFCNHFRDETNEDNWVINLIATNYLSHTRTYATEKKRTHYRRRCSSRSGHDNEKADDEADKEIDGDDEEPDKDAAPGEGEDDYAANAPAYSTTPRPSTSHDHNKPARTAAPSSSSALPAQASNHDNCCADKVVATEEALTKVDDAQAKAPNKSQPKGKGKQVAARPAHEESNSEEEALCLVPLKVNKAMRTKARINSPEPILPTKGRKRKAAEPEEPEEPESADEIQEPALKKQKPWPKMRPPPRPEPEPHSEQSST